MSQYICPKVLVCRRAGTQPVLKHCTHGKPHNHSGECFGEDCTKLDVLQRYKCACVKMESLRDANQLKIRLRDL